MLAPCEVTYFDYYQAAGPGEPLAAGPVVTATPRRGVRGARQLWTEYMPTPAAVEYMAFPRLSALAEAGWTADDRRDPADLLRRLRTHEQRLDALDINHRSLDGSRPGQRGGTGRRRRP